MPLIIGNVSSAPGSVEVNPAPLHCCMHIEHCHAGALDALLLPQRQHSAAPRDQALQAATSTARLAQLLVTLLQEAPQEPSFSLPKDPVWPKMMLSSWPPTLEEHNLRKLMMWPQYTRWVCQPYHLNLADHSKGRFPYEEADNDFRWLDHLPSSMVLAGREAAWAVNEWSDGWLDDDLTDLTDHFTRTE